MDDDQEICRVCRSESTPDHPLYHPCKCSGSIRFVHEDCLIEWLSHSKKKYCELCEHPFTFSPIYREDMPEKVPFYVLCSQLIYRFISLIKTFFRGLTVVIVWLIVLPSITLWTWRFYFWSGENIGFGSGSRNLTDLPFNTSNNSTTTIENESTSFLLGTLKNFLTDCLEGQIITAFVIIIFVAAYLFREWVMQNLPVEHPQLPEELINGNANLVNNEQLVQEQVALDTLLNAMQVINPTPPLQQQQQGNDFHHIERQMDQVRNELENELGQFNNRRAGWSSSINDHIVPENEDELFGGLNGLGGSASSNQSPASNLFQHNFSDEEEEVERYGGSRIQGFKHHQDEEDTENVDFRFNNNNEWLNHNRSESSNNTSRRRNISHYDDDEEIELEEEEDELPDLIDHNATHRRQQTTDEFERLFEQHMAEQRQRVLEMERREQQQQAEINRINAANAFNARAAVNANNANANAAAANDDDEPFDVGDDINGVLEAIGMRGNPWMLVQNSVLMSLMISLCLAVAVWIPYVIGRLVIMIRPMSFIETPIYVMRLVTDPLVDFVLDLCIPFIWSLVGNSVKSVVPESIQLALESMTKQLIQGMDMILSFSNETSTAAVVTSDTTTTTIAAQITTETGHNLTASKISATADSLMMNIDWTLIQNKVETMSTVALARWHRFATGQTGLDRSMCILVGYLVLICLGSWYLTHGKRRNTGGRVRTNGDTFQDIIRQQGIFLKVLFFILIELVVFPTVCGFLLDMATLPLFVNASFTSRYAFHIKSPYSSYFLHWFLGTGVLFYFAIFITVCREIIRPGVMWFIRDPNDPQFHPVQEMVERPLPNLLHKISQSALIYSVMLVFGVGAVTFSLAFTGIVFPLRLPFNTPLSTLAIDLLIIQFLLPPLIALIKPRDYSKKALDLWWHFACRQLRLTSFMFNERKPDEEGRHVRRTLKSMVLRQKAAISQENEYSEVGIMEEEDDQADVVFQRDGMMVRVPKYDSVPVDPKRRMLVPVDPVTLEAIDEEERRRGHPATADTNNEAESTIVVYIPPHFKQRVIIFLFSMWFSISLFTCSVTVLPLLVGRGLFKYYLAPGSKVNDLYSFALGIYLMAGLATLVHWMTECYSTYHDSNKDEIMTYIKEKTGKIAKFLYLSSMFGLVIPLLFGIAVDLFVFMPIRSFNSETGLVIYISQNWSFGVAYLSIIHNLIHVLPANNRIQQKLNEIIGGDGGGIMQTDLYNITRTVIAPVILTAILSIIVPGIISWGILQLLDSKDPSLQITVARYTYPIIFCCFITVLAGFIFKKLFNLWMQTVRDDTYLIGKKLHNLQESSSGNNEASTSSTIEQDVAVAH